MSNSNKKATKLNLEKEFSFKHAIEHYKQIGVNIAPGKSLIEIEQTEQQLNFEFPDDFKEFHSMCNGFSEWEMDNYYFSIWTFDRMIEEYEQEKKEDPEFIPICDYLINSHWYGYIRNRNGIFKGYDRKEYIADNFEEFLKLLISDSEKLY